MTRRVARSTRTHAGARPKVLIVDDHRPVLEMVSAVLADDFDVVGTTTDGRHAIDMAHKLEPEVIILDVQMPGVDGFQTLGMLQETGLATPVVFLSMHHADEYVSQAFRCGARGYVLKPRILRDLPTALEQTLLGQSFVPSLTSLLQLGERNVHAMQLHHDSELFLDSLATFFDCALRRGDATCVIATERIRQALDGRLRARGWNVEPSTRHRRYLVVDADDALNRFMRNGLPDRDQLAEIAAEMDQYRREVAEGTTSRLTLFGNMVMCLNACGNTEGMIALESMWNALTHDLPFLTVCGYSERCFHDETPALWRDVCAEHSALNHAHDV